MLFKYIHWLPLIIAFIAGSFALIQIRVNNITNARLKWLDSLKNHLADFNSEVFKLSMNKAVVKKIDELEAAGSKSETAENFAKTVNAGLIDHLKIIQHKFDMIRLNLNPKEDLHISLMNLLDNYMALLNKIPKMDVKGQAELAKEMSTCSEKLILVVRFILKLEWEKIKKSSINYYWYMHFGKGEKLKTEALSVESNLKNKNANLNG